MKFVEWLNKKLDSASTTIKVLFPECDAIVTPKDQNNPNFQIWGAMSDFRRRSVKSKRKNR